MSEHKLWVVYEDGIGKFYFDAQFQGDPVQTFGPYYEKDQAEVQLAQCSAMWE